MDTASSPTPESPGTSVFSPPVFSADKKPFAWEKYDAISIYCLSAAQDPYCLFASRLLELIGLPQLQERRGANFDWFKVTEWFCDSCPLCCLVFGAEERHQLKERFTERLQERLKEMLLDIEDYLQATLSLVARKSTFTSSSGNRLTCHIDIEIGSSQHGFDIWSEEGSLASSSITSYKPISCANANDTADFVLRCLEHCKLNHLRCNSKLFTVGNSTNLPLPARLLEISGDCEAPVVRLVKTSTRIEYCTLSHWYAKASPIISHIDQLLSTTLSNYEDHLQGIKFGELPLSFQDAVQITLCLGISYIWIDSLCIIQDSKDDWSHESVRMGGIYKGAVLTIAAAGAKDSTEGLFMRHRAFTPVIRLPFIVDGQAQGEFYLRARPDVFGALGGTPLRERAWAFQEWYLSPRCVFMTDHAAAWKCEESQCVDNGTYDHLNLTEHQSWYALLNEYSSKKLTLATDRLIALQALFEEFANGRDRRCVAGVWEDELLEHLLWIACGDNFDTTNLLDLPSWSWAYSNDTIGFVQQLHVSCPLIQLAESMSIMELASSPARLVTSAHVSHHVFDISGPCCPYCVELFYSSPEQTLGGKYWRGNRFAMALKHSKGDNNVYGFATFDKGIMDKPTLVLCAESRRDEKDALHPRTPVKSRRLDDHCRQIRTSGSSLLSAKAPVMDQDRLFTPDIASETTTKIDHIVAAASSNELPDESKGTEELYRTGNGHNVQDEELARDDEVVKDGKDWTQYHPFSLHDCPEEIPGRRMMTWLHCGFYRRITPMSSESVYYALMLEPVQGEDMVFRRVGLALLYPRAKAIFDEHPPVTITII